MTEPVKRRSHGDGGIDPRGENVHRLRYRVDGKRFTKTFRGTLTEARKELRSLVRSGDVGDHVAPDKMKVGQWIEAWITAGAPGRKREKVSQRTLERYEQLLNTHVKPVLGMKPLQKLRAPDIDGLYTAMAKADTIAPRTQRHVHVVFNSCLATATRKGMLAANPMLRVEQIPTVNSAEQSPILETGLDVEAGDDADDIGEGLTEAELATLVAGFQTSSLYPVVATAASSGARRNELLALRWSDLNTEKSTVRIERAWEQTKKFGLRLKPPKTRRGLRTIELDANTLAMLVREKERHQRIAAGIPDGSPVDLSLIKLPATSLMFPAVPEPGEDFSFSKPRNPRNFSKEFARKAGLLGFGATRFHDLRGIHSTALLDADIPVHIVAHRLGDDPAILLRNYVKRKRSKNADKKLSDAIAGMAAGFLKQ